jgi:amino acid adenylation domain-containing protein
MNRTTPNLPTLISALAGLAHRYTGQDEITLEISGGSTLQLTLSLLGDPKFERLLEQVRNCVSETESVWIRPLAFAEELTGAAPRSELVLLFHFVTRSWELTFSSNAFQAEFAHLSDHLERFLQSGHSAPDRRISQIDFLSPEEALDLAHQWQGPVKEYPTESIHGIFEEVCRSFPNRIALIEARGAISFCELNQRANRIARWLQGMGVTHETLVGVHLEASIESIAAILGILKAGGAFVPLDPEYPLERLTAIACDANLRFIISNSSQVDFSCGAELLSIEESRQVIQSAPDTNPDRKSSPSQLAYVIYTSGSTGEARGVMGIHRSITNGLAEIQFDPQREGEVSCLNSPLSVGISLLPLFLPLLSGVPLVIVSTSQFRDPLRLAEVVRDQNVSTIGLSTPALRLWLTLGDRLSPMLPRLRSVIVGGAPVTPDLAERFQKYLPWSVLENGYGATELGSIAARGVVSPVNAKIGRPVTNTRIYLLDKYGATVPNGGIGEIYVSSDHLARGYLNRPDLTASRFLPDPFGGAERMFKTGDFGRATHDGIEFLGRADDQVKIRGFRVHLSEVESALSGCAGVEGAALAVRKIASEDRLVAFLTGPDTRPSDSYIREYLRKWLPEYMIPTAFLWLDDFPTTASGKLDRNALPTPSLREITVLPSSPNDEIEIFLVELWQSILMIEKTGIHNHFLDLGGDSLFAADITSRIWERYGLELDFVSLFKYPTIAELANHIRESLTKRGTQSLAQGKT